MNVMYYLTNQEMIHQNLKKGIKINTKDLMPRIYLADNWDWVNKIYDFYASIDNDNKDNIDKFLVIKLNLIGIHVFPDDIPIDLLPDYWEQSTKEAYSKHCFFTSEDIPVSSIKKIYDFNGNDLTTKYFNEQ